MDGWQGADPAPWWLCIVLLLILPTHPTRCEAAEGQLLGKVAEMEKRLGQELEEQARAGGGSSGVGGVALDRDLLRSRMRAVDLGFHRWWIRFGAASISCRLEDCPRMGQCKAAVAGEEQGGVGEGGGKWKQDELQQLDVGACWNPGLDDEKDVVLPAPLNCPKLSHLDNPGPVGRDTSCSHREDFSPRRRVAHQVFQLRNVYVEPGGVVVNSSAFFLREGCDREVTRDYPRGSVGVQSLPWAVNLVYPKALTYFHAMVELLPQFLVLAPLLSSMPDLPILSTTSVWEVYSQLFEPIVGMPLGDINAYSIPSDSLYFVQELYQPMYQLCSVASVALWRELRQRVLLAPEGVPMFGPRWGSRSPVPATPTQRTQLPPNWMVLVAQRRKPQFRILQINDIERLLLQMFPSDRILFLRHLPSIPDAREVFRRTALFVSAHSSALTNMIFMPEGATVLEVRPNMQHNARYNTLARACNLRYYLHFAEGTQNTPTSVDIDKLRTLLLQVRAGMRLTA